MNKNSHIALFLLLFIFSVKSYSQTYEIGFNASLGGFVFKLSDDKKHGVVCETINQGKLNWNDAKQTINNASFHSAEGKKFQDWRLPSKEEFQEMMKYTAPFGNLSFNVGRPGWLECYWTSSSCEDCSQSIKSGVKMIVCPSRNSFIDQDGEQQVDENVDLRPSAELLKFEHFVRAVRVF